MTLNCSDFDFCLEVSATTYMYILGGAAGANPASIAGFMFHFAEPRKRVLLSGTVQV